MTRVSGASVMAFGAVMASMFSLGMSLTTAACSSRTESAPEAAKPVPAVTSVGAAVAARSEQHLTAVQPATTAVVAPTVLSATTAPKAQPAVIRSDAADDLIVKRFLVTSGVHEREPESLTGAIRVDGKPVFAFAEVQNKDGSATNVRVTFQRKGSPEQVGNVTLSVPAQTQRYRTWGTTRFIREAGSWEAVLWSEDGKELARVAFEVEA